MLALEEVGEAQFLATQNALHRPCKSSVKPSHGPDNAGAERQHTTTAELNLIKFIITLRILRYFDLKNRSSMRSL